MDQTVKRWDWLPAQMPGVAKLMREKRREFGDAHVNQCWLRGVVELQPGFFFAREGALTVGTPWPDADEAMANFAAANVMPGQFLLILAAPEVGPGFGPSTKEG